MENVVTDCIQRRIFSQKGGILVDAYHAAGLPDSPEHIVRHVTAVIPHRPAVGMRGNNGGPCDFDNVPEALIAAMAHIYQHSKCLGVLYIGLAQIRQAAAGEVGANERILLIPA